MPSEVNSNENSNLHKNEANRTFLSHERINMMKTLLLIGMLFIAASLTHAQNGNASSTPAAQPADDTPIKKLNQDIRADKKAIQSDKHAIRQDNAAQRAQIRDLNSQEKASIDAVKAAAAKTKAERDAAIRQIHSDFKSKKDSVRSQMKADRQTRRADINKERVDLKTDREQRRTASPRK